MPLPWRGRALVALAVLASARAQDKPLELQDLINEALRDNQEILAAQKRYEASRQRPRQQSSLPDPTLSLGYFSNGNPLPGAGLGKETLHRIVVVGGGAAGPELVTRLGDRLGRRGWASVTLIECARTHLWKPLLHAVAAGNIDAGEYKLNYLAQAYWHPFQYRFGTMVGIDRVAKEVKLAAAFDEEGQHITPARTIAYDTLVIAIRSVTNDFGTEGASKYAVPLETNPPCRTVRYKPRHLYLRSTILLV